MGSIRGYLGGLISVFFRWWWAALTGLASILGVLLASEAGITVNRLGITLLIFGFSFLLFLVISLMVTSWEWYKRGVHPFVTQIISDRTADPPLTFVVAADHQMLSVGTQLALFRITNQDIEVCAAILTVKSCRTDGKGFQAEPLWISPMHKTDFQKRQVRCTDLRLRVISGEIFDVVERYVREQVQ